MNSCLYETSIMHHRLSPREHRFEYKFFSFYLDLDEIDSLAQNIWMISRNRWNVYSLYDKDHIDKGMPTIKENLLAYLKEQGINVPISKVMLLTNLRMLGYVFNPVSFYFCFDASSQPVCVIPEIGNTFGEIKPFLIDADHRSGNTFKDQHVKHYYISPFTKLDDHLDFRLTIPDEQLNLGINTTKNKTPVIVTTMKGKRSALTNKNLLWLSLKFPFVTLKVIALIHWHALLLWRKKIPYEEKDRNMHLQRGLYRQRHVHLKEATRVRS
jgi:DUF1365 family protein